MKTSNFVTRTLCIVFIFVAAAIANAATWTVTKAANSSDGTGGLYFGLLNNSSKTEESPVVGQFAAVGTPS